MEQRQVVVVGAGPAGAATAFFLGRAGVDVLLLDKAAFPRDKTCGDAVSPRALGVLREMEILEDVSTRSHLSAELRLFAPNHREVKALVPRPAGLPDHVLVIKRWHLDHLVLQRAISAGAEFRVGRVTGLLHDGGAVTGVEVEGGATVRTDLVVLATGVSTPLLKAAGMLPRRPAMMMAARAYYEDISGLTPQLEFYFDHVSLPGYGWLFPLGPGSANVGVGFMGKLDGSPLTAFQTFIRTHPRMRALLPGARAQGAVRGYPLRVDFPSARKIGPGVLGVGEAVGLVNPFTGEGIDYALESGQIAGETIAQVIAPGHQPTAAHLKPYVERLDSRFRKLFLVLNLARRLYCNGPMLNRMFGRGPERQHAVNTLVGICFGTLDPSQAFAPRTLFDLLRP